MHAVVEAQVAPAILALPVTSGPIDRRSVVAPRRRATHETMMGEDFTEEDLDAGDVLEDADDGDENGREREDSIDLADLKPMDAFLMKMEDLVTEMERRHLHPKGFFNDDARELQKHFDQEHAAELENLKQERRAQQQRSRMKAQGLCGHQPLCQVDLKILMKF